MIIGLNGYAGSGKDTAGEYLVMAHGFTRFAFADLLKDSVCSLFGIPREQVDRLKLDVTALVTLYIADLPVSENSGIIKEMSFRGFLQRYGTEAHREVFGEDFWVDQLFSRMLTSTERAVITDVRFLNEAERILQFGGLVLRINRSRLFEDDTHASEQPLPDWLISGEVDNSGDLSTLYKKLDCLVASAELNRSLTDAST